MDKQPYFHEEEELMALAPEFDTSGMSGSAQRRMRRVNDMETSLAYVKAAHIANHNKVTLVALLCQGQVDEAVSILLQRNPRKYVAMNLIGLSQANARYLSRVVSGDDDDDWR